MPGQGMLGRSIVDTIGGQSFLGINTKGITINNEPVEVTDDNSDGHAEYLATPGVKTIEINQSIVVKNLEVARAILTNESQMYPWTRTYPDGSTLTGSIFMTSYSETGETAEAATADISFNVSGKPTFVAGIGGGGS